MPGSEPTLRPAAEARVPAGPRPAASRATVERLRALLAESRRAQQVLSLATLVAAWWLLSLVFPPYLVPPIPAVIDSILRTLGDRAALASAGLTYLRILVGLLGGFAVGALIGLAMALNAWAERSFEPFVRFLQGVPALSWVVFAVIWFSGIEQRVLFVLMVNTLPIFAIQVHDGVKAIPADLWDMVRVWRPTRSMLVRKLVLPGVLPHVLTAWKVALGNATRVVIVAELVGATTGVGYQLRLAQERFVMADAVTWTLALVLFAYLSEWLLAVLERHLLRYRPALEG